MSEPPSRTGIDTGAAMSRSGGSAKPQRRGSPRERIGAIDAARGLAMLLVCLAHFVSYAPLAAYERLSVAMTLGMVASPTFMIISGMMIGLLHARRGAAFAGTRIRLIDRGLFLLTIGHVLIMGAFLSPWSRVPLALHRTVITDAIAIALIAGALLVTRAGIRRRLEIAAALYLVSWAIALLWTPDALALRWLKDVFIGTRTDAVLINTFPIVPWVAVHLAATCLGGWYARALERDGARTAAWQLVRLGIAAVAAFMIVKTAFMVLRPAELTGFWWGVYALTYQLQKRPPGLGYLLFFGGAGVVLAGLLMLLSLREWSHAAVGKLATIGKASLAVFIVQFYVYRVVMPAIPDAYGAAWPLVFLASLVVIWGFAHWWTAVSGNDLFTVGLRPRHEYRTPPAAAAAAASAIPTYHGSEPDSRGSPAGR